MEQNQGQVAEKTKVQKARRFQVIFLNDDYTTFEFVMAMLINYFQKTPSNAADLTKEVHEKGRCVAGVFSKEVADEKIEAVHETAKQNGYPLKLILEPEE